MTRKILALSAAFSLSLGLAGCQTPSQPSTSLESKPKVVATFYPLHEFAKAVAGDKAEVSSVIQGGTEPHDYEPSPREVATIHEADLFILNGAGLDPWAERLERELPIRVVVLHLAPLLFPNEESVDPHFWLSPLLAQQEVRLIGDSLGRLDPAHRETYEANAAATIQKLHSLDQRFKEGLQACESRRVVVSHDAFGYWEKRYGIELVPIVGFSPEEEPSARRLAELSDLVKKEKVKTIFFETLVSPKLAQTLASETGANTAVLNPLEGLTAEEVHAGKDYFSVMEENLAALRKALGCR